MSRLEVVQSHMEVLMHEVLGLEDELVVAPDGEVVVSTERGTYSVRVRDRGEPHIEVYSVLLEVDADPGLYEALNEINAKLSHCRVFWYRGRVVLAGEVVGATADEESLACLCNEVAHNVDTETPNLADVFGGDHDEEDA